MNTGFFTWARGLEERIVVDRRSRRCLRGHEVRQCSFKSFDATKPLSARDSPLFLCLQAQWDSWITNPRVWALVFLGAGICALLLEHLSQLVQTTSKDVRGHNSKPLCIHGLATATDATCMCTTMPPCNAGTLQEQLSCRVNSISSTSGH